MYTEIEYVKIMDGSIEEVNKNFPYVSLTMKGIYREHDGYCSGADEDTATEIEVDTLISVPIPLHFSLDYCDCDENGDVNNIKFMKKTYFHQYQTRYNSSGSEFCNGLCDTDVIITKIKIVNLDKFTDPEYLKYKEIIIKEEIERMKIQNEEIERIIEKEKEKRKYEDKILCLYYIFIFFFFFCWVQV